MCTQLHVYVPYVRSFLLLARAVKNKIGEPQPAELMRAPPAPAPICVGCGIILQQVLQFWPKRIQNY